MSRRHLALGACALVIALGGCGGDDEESEEPTVAETVAETGTGGETETETESIATVATGPTFTEAEAGRAAGDAAREFNRVANLGRIDEACETYLSEALLAVVAAERGCAGTLAIIRGKGKIQMNVQSSIVLDDRPSVSAIMGQVPDTSVADIRRYLFVYEDGAWKIDSVVDAGYDVIVSPAAETDPGFTIATETSPEGDTVTEEPVVPFTEKEATAEIIDTLGAFNRTANQGKLQEACQGYFSMAFLARLPTERACATTLAGSRGGRGKVEMKVDGGRVFFEHDDPTRARTFVDLERPEGFKQILADHRKIQMVYENGAWKIDAVNAP